MLRDAFFGSLPILAVEWRPSVETFIEYDADAPLVATAIVRLSPNDFGSHILAGPNDASCKLSSLSPIAVIEQPFSFRALLGIRLCSGGEMNFRGIFSLFQLPLFLNVLLVTGNVNPKLLEQAVALIRMI